MVPPRIVMLLTLRKSIARSSQVLFSEELLSSCEVAERGTGSPSCIHDRSGTMPGGQEEIRPSTCRSD